MMTLFVPFTHIPFVYLEKAEEDKEKQKKQKKHNQLTKVTTLLHLFI